MASEESERIELGKARIAREENVSIDMLSASGGKDPFDLFEIYRMDFCELCGEWRMVNFFGDCGDCKK